MVVNMHQAKTQLSKLVAAANKGTEVVIAKDGQPMVKLMALKNQKRQPRKPKGWPKQVLEFCGLDIKPFETLRDVKEPKDPIV